MTSSSIATFAAETAAAAAADPIMKQLVAENKLANVAITKLPDGVARGVNRRTAPMTTAKPTKAQKDAGHKHVTSKGVKTTADAKTPAAASTPKAKAATAATPAKQANAKAPAGDVITPAMIAAKFDITAKALRARMRKQADKWNALLTSADRAKGAAYTIRNNQANWKTIEKLLA
jgi:hypothetical protein